MQGMYAHEINDETFLKLKQKSKEHFFVVDNTDYPEAILDPDWIFKNPNSDPTLDHIFVDVNITSTFTSNEKFFFWNWVFIILIIILFSLLFFVLLCYCWKVRKYNGYVSERRALKQELIKIKDTEYTNFLMR